jgi:hypothetical protein
MLIAVYDRFADKVGSKRISMCPFGRRLRAK